MSCVWQLLNKRIYDDDVDDDDDDSNTRIERSVVLHYGHSP